MVIGILSSPVSFNNKHKVADTTKPINSYLYTPRQQVKLPVETPLPLPEMSEINHKVNAEPTQALQSMDTTIVKPKNAPIIDKSTNTAANDKHNSSSSAQVKVSEQILTSSTSNKKVSIAQKALSQLKDLPKQLQQQSIDQELYQHFRHKSPSVMHGQPTAVPNSVMPLTQAQQKQQNTQRLSDDISITKSDNGSCFIEQDLTSVGIEGVKAISMFNCGESKFDKNFRQHMKAVSKKLGK